VISDVRVLALTRRWLHHTKNGGYDHLARVVGAEVVTRFERSQLFWHGFPRWCWRICKRTQRYSHGYKYEDWLAERSLLAKARRRSPDLVHVLYGDRGLELLLRHRSRLPCPLMITFHLPGKRGIDRFEFLRRHLVSGMDVAVVVARCQIQDYQRGLGSDRVFYIPHGIDTQCFAPGGSTRQRPGVRLVTVGQFLRDFRALRAIIDECNVRKLPVQFDLVMDRGFWPAFTECPNVRLHTKIEETELIRMYREADALLMPLADATANNAVLEALACGTPVISNKVGGIADYVDDDCSWLFEKGEVGGMVNLIDAICGDREIASSRRAAGRRKSLDFDWSRIADQMRELYRVVATGNSRASAENKK
jgi:glycosyltransferase involved in cell wall biosynthesis